MNIDCCKSYVGKQVIGLLPDGGGTPPEPKCVYFGFVDFYSETYNNLYLDDAQTIPAFSDFYGNGNLKNYMNGIGGDLYYSFYSFGSFVFSGCFLFYEGTSLIPSIPIYDSVGGQINTIDFQENTLYSYSCTNDKCFTKTFDKSFIELYNLAWMSSPFTLSADYSQSNPFYNIDISDVVTMDTLIRSIYGTNSTYNWVDNLNGTATITLSNCYDWGSLPTLLLSDGIGNFLNITLEEIPC